MNKKQMIIVNEDMMPLKAACILFGIPYSAVYARLRAGWDPKKALETPVSTTKGRPKKTKPPEAVLDKGTLEALDAFSEVI